MKTNQQVIHNWVSDNVPNIETRDYQIEAWAALQERRSEGRKRALVHLATGLGKTSVAAVDVLHYLKKEKPGAKILFVSHMNDISQQAKNTFLFVNPKFTTDTFTGHNRKLANVDVTFSTFQSLYSQLENIDPKYFSYIIWDEAHHIEAETFSAVRKHFDPDFELGLTATPDRADGRDILNYFGRPVFVKTLSDGINEGWLSSVDYHIVFDEAIKNAINDKFELKSLRDIRDLFAIRSRNEIISEEVLTRRHEIGLDKAKTIVFCQNILAASQMATLLGGEVYNSNVSAEDRIDILKRFKNGALQVICTVDMFNEGIDIPDARLVVFLRSTSSRTIFEQQLGRGLRKAPGKDSVTVLDFVANIERINFVRELGRHVNNKTINPGSGISGVDSGDKAIQLDQGFHLNTFEFEDQVVELMDRYDEIVGIDYLKTDEVVDTYHKLGDSISLTSKHYGVTWQAIKKHMVKAGIDTSGYFAKTRSVSVEEAVAKYKELGSINKTASFFGIGSWGIREKLKKAGVEYDRPNTRNYATPELIAAFKEVGSVRGAARKIGISYHQARKWLLNSGIPTSQPSDRPGRQKIDPVELAKAYKEHNGDIRKIVESVGKNSWTNVYKALDDNGFLKRPVTSAVASAAYYKFGNATKAAEYLGVSNVIISRKAKEGRYITKYKQGVKNV